MPIPNLVPLGLGELLDQTFSHFRKHFWLFAGIMVAPQAILVALNILLQVSLGAFAPRPGPANPHDMAVFGLRALLGYMGMLIPYFLIYALALGATTYALSEIHLGRMTTIRESYRVVRKRIWRLINVISSILLRSSGAIFLAILVPSALAGLLVTLVPGSATLAGVLGVLGIVLGFLVGGVLAVVFLLRYSVAVPALVLENLSARKALKRSVALTRGFLWRLMVVGVLMWIIQVVIVGICQAPFMVASMVVSVKGVMPGLWLTIPSLLVGGAGGAATAPLFTISFAIAYYDLRVRKEGFDLQLMMAHLDDGNPQGATAPIQIEEDERLQDANVFELALSDAAHRGALSAFLVLALPKSLEQTEFRGEAGSRGTRCSNNSHVR